MNHPIGLTPSDLVSIIMAVCGGIITLSAAFSIIWKIIDKARSPEVIQNNRLTALEEEYAKLEQKFKDYDTYLDRDKKRLDNLEFGNEATNEALLALLNNAINPDGTVEELKTAKKKLEKYLISRKVDINEALN